MDQNNIRRASSVGYRLPVRSNGTRPAKAQPPADRTRHTVGDTVSSNDNPDKRDPVKQDQVWKELVWSERRGIREWWVGNYLQWVQGKMKAKQTKSKRYGPQGEELELSHKIWSDGKTACV